ncbi:MAG: glycosyltransferase [Candidatus Limnocylindrales bacterium]|jgi:glycosyltransferase involved in cell wall biosynthesis
MSHILFAGINYWPELSGISPYTTGLAEYLANCGHRVTVITGFPHYPSWSVDPAYRGELRRKETIAGVEVIRRRHYVPSHQSVVGRGLYEVTFFAHGLLSRPDPPDVVIGVTPSLSGGALARIFAARWHVPYGLIVQDLMGRAAKQSGMAAGGLVAGGVSRLEAWTVGRARAVGVVSPSFVPYLRSLGVRSSRIVDLPNWNVRPAVAASAAETRERLGWGQNHIVLHAGNMGLKQGLEQVLEAARISAMSEPLIRFVLLGDGNQRAQLQRAATGLANVQFLPSQSDDDYAAALAAADVLLLCQRASVADMSLPSKLTSYCAAGRPIVAAVRGDGATYREIQRTGAALAVPAGDPEALLDAITCLRDDPAESARLGAAGASYAATALGSTEGLERGRKFVEGLLAPASPREPAR